ncbi:type VI secretion system tip protein VgrG [Ideonella sp. 4Y16]|uniref:Type VI secretion system tip protein VgrG n=1 Tax=Ideonella alba TaxID=2824118 RepID=A0A940Y901_9BURK|nr:type VI secretion system tip protein TssI/VgrG [Ideonella alba]MBQ0930385.1 type VI secretion system tip protein VgrG [Ideonella alba]MBQ0946260.1 type VI secretion system tip protein VgrG [Ideonella alba]
MAKLDAEFKCVKGPDALLFHRLQAVEELGRLPQYRIELLRPRSDPVITPDDLLGTRATVKLLLADGSYRYINGFVTRFERGGSQGKLDRYFLDLNVWLWYLQLGADCRIFQGKTVIEIIKAVFGDYSNQSVQDKSTATYKPRDFCVQYNESDFDFVTRLMEQEGLYYYFTHEDGQHKLVLCDDASGHDPIPGASLAWASTQTDNQLRDDMVTDWRLVKQVGSLKYTHDDHDFQVPSTSLEVTKMRTPSYPNPGDLEVRHWPGAFYDLKRAAAAADHKGVGERFAQGRVDAYKTQQIVASAETRFRAIAAGKTFKLKEHTNDNGDYLVTRLVFTAEFGEYEANVKGGSRGFQARFDAIPKSIRFQPQLSVAWPRINGPQTAVVVGGSGDEIATDEHGRVKLKFRWDRVNPDDLTASCWVRVSHPWASKNFGMIAIPRVGDEVVVEFLDGDPDRPLVTGRVYNAERMPPYELPAQKTVTGIRSRSTKQGGEANFNELRFDDLKGSEYVWFQAEKDYHQLVKNDAKITVKNDRWDKVEKNVAQQIGENLTVDVGKKATLSIKEDVHAKLGADFNLKIEGALNTGITDAVAVKGDQAISITSGQGMDINVGQAFNATATSSLHLKGMGVVIDGSTTLCIKAGGSFILVGPDGVTIQGAMVKINSGGSAGNANDAAQASPADPTAPTLPDPDQDPLASGS